MSDYPMLKARLVSIHIGKPQTIRDAAFGQSTIQSWTTGFYKEPASGLLLLERTNLVGDGQADLKNHGGPEKAVNVYPAEHYSYWKQTVNFPQFKPGAFGENFTTEGVLETDVCIGDIFKIGEALVQISQPRQPCWKLARRWNKKDLALRVQETGRTGWYFRVLREGHLQAGDSLVLIERPCPQWTVAAANEVMHHPNEDADTLHRLADCTYLAGRWQTKLKQRALTGVVEDQSGRLEGPMGDK